MNGILNNPFNITYPTAVQTSLNSAASFAKFDTSGRFVAAGRNDGSAVVWDLDTKAPVRWLEGHVKGVTSVDWSRNSRYVLTSSKDWNVIVWDLASDSDPTRRQATIRFDAPVISASFHPRNSKILLVLLGTGETYLVDLRKDHRGRFELCEAQEESDDEGQSSRPRSAMTAARFDPSGRWVFIGTNTGCVLVFNTRTKTMVARHKISGVGILKGLDFAKSGRRLVTNSSDRILRQFNLPLYPPPSADGEYIEQELEPMYRFNDPISKIAWHSMSYSPDGEWLAGGAADNANHKIYIWDISNDGQFAAVLDGGREPLLHIHWHPAKAMIASTTNQGNILIWHCPTPERWGAFAGGFEEVDENVEYEEREDEFDIEDEDESALRKQKAEEEEVDINGVDDSALLVDHLHRTADDDEDIAWALEEPDDDEGGWRLKVMIDDDDVY
ncbi:COMPASS complex protein [Wolfiporia cocos MD-104 SS10]|uniref:COMPASS complex protein n=1 Tax=Wolfiporia cocos (strain MD-104) TaxID=742152 RepID=A0A2H3JXX5_WOLCO|nr:COMPASS complex protein [Wolfiporia cocos MD-104 SS10]